MADFFKALFDFNFSTFITKKLIKPLYLVFVVLAGLGSLAMFLTMLRFQPIMAIIFVPLYFLFLVVSVRIWMEALVLLFDINDRTETLAAGQQRPQPNPGSLPPL